MSALAAPSYHCAGAAFLARNEWFAARLQPLPARTSCGYELSGLDRRRFDAFLGLHASLRARSVNAWRRSLYRHRGSALVVVAVDETGSLAGFDMYYFRAGEARRGTVHEAFVGVAPSHRGRGIATAMRLLARESFAAGGLSALSSRVEATNEASLRSAVAAGFAVAAETTEPDGGVVLDLVCPLP